MPYGMKGPIPSMRMPSQTAVRQLLLGCSMALAASALARSAEAQELRDQYHSAPRDTVSQEVYDGWKQYNLNCARCHGEDVLGTTIAPHLIVSLKPDGPINTKELFLQTVCAGRPEKGMPSWCALGMDPAHDREDLLLREGPKRCQDGGGTTGPAPGIVNFRPARP